MKRGRDNMELTLAHWLYGLITLVIIGTMVFRKGVVLPTLFGTFLVALVYQGNLVDGFTAIFQANLVAAQELFNIFLIITFMLALLNSLKDLGADRQMIQPIQKMMTNGHVSFFVLVSVTYVISLFFWPTPAVPLICALLVPAAVRAGLPVMTAAVAIAIAGQGMALSSDYIVQVAPSLSATAAGVDTIAVADKALVLSIISGGVAIMMAYLIYRKNIRSRDDERNEIEVENMQSASTTDKKQVTKNLDKWGRIFAVLVPLTLLGVVIYMVYEKLISGRMSGLEGGDGAAFVGGVAVILLLLSTIAFGKRHAMDYIITLITL